jgi:hypothetical protein
MDETHQVGFSHRGGSGDRVKTPSSPAANAKPAVSHRAGIRAELRDIGRTGGN